MIIKKIVLSFLLALMPSIALAAHGVSIDGSLKYPADFSRFDYTSAEAKKGGDLVLHGLGGFDKMNPFTLKGMAPDGLDSLLFERLAVSSLDEPFAKYGLLAKDIALAEDGLSVTFILNKEARFSDGTPVQSSDVKFSLETLKSNQAHPMYSAYLQDIVSADILGPQTIRFNFSQRNRELHMIACEVPVFSEKFYTEHPFEEQSLTPPVASGPYVVENFKPGKNITYKRNPDYWAKDHPTRKGMFNYDRITYKFFKDQLVSLEAFKAREFDFMFVNISKQWVRDMTGAKFQPGQILKDLMPHNNNQGMQCFLMNLRQEKFQDRRVRQALALAFDFQWTNKSIFFDQYAQSDSFFSNSYLAARGLPQGLELEYLEPFKDQLPAEVFTTPLTPISTDPPSSLRKNLRQAKKLLEAAGWQVKDGKLVKKENPQEVFKFEIILASASFERVMAPYVNNLKKLGFQVTYRTLDPALYVQRRQAFDFEMMVNVFGQSQSPGNEQRDMWHSNAADRPGSRNLLGLKDPVVDALVDKIIYSQNQQELTAACMAMDRVLWYGYYVVPNWFVAKHRVAYWDIFNRPKTLPTFYSVDQALMTWWMK